MKKILRGKQQWDLLDRDGESISAFTAFCKAIENLAYATQKRYVEVLASFIDYLYEAGVFGAPPELLPSAEHVNEVIDAYPRLLILGSEELARRINANTSDSNDEAWLLRVAATLGRLPYNSSSMSNTLAAINKFLRLSKRLAQNTWQAAKRRGIALPFDEFELLIRAVQGSSEFTQAEKKQVRQNSMLGGVIRLRGELMSRPRGLSIGGPNSGSLMRAVKDFPLDQVGALLEAATCWRDRTFWLLLPASGLRQSEALNLTWANVDWDNREIYVDDPRFIRMGRLMTNEEKIRFKGRVVSWTHLFEPLRTMFFESLVQYKRLEYVLPSCDKAENDFIFQYLTRERRGQPLCNASNTALNSSLHGAIRRAGIPGHRTKPEDLWDLHSFRHSYGMHMLNDALFTEPDGTVRHLTMSEVQILMGHEDINATRKYARLRDETLKRGLETSDRFLLSGGEIDVNRLTPTLSSRLRMAASYGVDPSFQNRVAETN